MKRRIPSLRHRSIIVLLIALASFSGVIRASALVDRTADADMAAAISSVEDGSGTMPTEAAESGEGIDAVKKYMTRSKRSIYFARDSAELSAEALSTISDNAERLKSRPELTVTLVGFSDILGSSSYSVALAQRRAKVVTDALVRMGVATRQIRPSAVGLEDPSVMPCITEICRISYRRVEFRYRGVPQRDPPHAEAARNR